MSTPTGTTGALGTALCAAVRRLGHRLGADHEELPVAHNFSEDPAGVVVDSVVRHWLETCPTLDRRPTTRPGGTP